MEPRTPLPHPRDLYAALGRLTALPLPRPGEASQAFARSTVFFPLAGLFLGVALAGVRWCTSQWLPAWAVAIVVVAVWEALGATWRDSPWRHRAGAGIVLSVAVKIVCLVQQAGGRPAALLFAPMLGRWTMVVLAVGARDAGAPERKFNAAITFREFALTSVFSCAVVFATADAFGVLIIVCVAALSLVGRWLCHRGGGVSWHRLFMGAQLTEALVLVLFSLLPRR